MKTIKIISVLFLLVCVRYAGANTLIIHAGTNGTFAFSPSSIDVTVGDTVQWIWDAGAHTTTSTLIPGGAAVWDSPLDHINTSFIYVVTVAGQYNFKCSIHQVLGMTGVINVSPIGIQPISGNVPQKFSLYQNYPNPFNPVTNIRFELPQKTLARLKIFDMNGREVALLVNEVLEPGTYNVDWDASQYASGTYFYQFSTKEFTQTKKLILLK